MIAFFNLINNVLTLYAWAVIIMVALHLLITFDVVNRSNRFIYLTMDFLTRLTEPLLRPLRRILPDFGAVDISPLVLILLIYFVLNLLS